MTLLTKKCVGKGIDNHAKGNIGESIACDYLKKRDFIISERNYRKPWGELDIIAVKNEEIHFVEVKSVTVSSFNGLKYSYLAIGHNPEENVNAFKLHQIRKMIKTYISERELDFEMEFKFHIICVYMNMSRRVARVHWIQNIIL